MNELYPSIEPYETFRLKVSNLHEIYVEQSGNPEGKPVIFLHGGPGGGLDPVYRQYFNPEKWRIIMFDQRGCGKSTPHAELQENTTWDLVEDIEKIRSKLHITSWTVFGGSWGSTLALTYGITHPDKCDNLVLRGIFLLRQKEIDWFYQDGCHYIYPDAWEDYIAPIAADERDQMIQAYYKRLTSDDEDIRLEAAKAWSVWEASTSQLLQNKSHMADCSKQEYASGLARIECHYFTNKGFFDTDGWLLDNIDKVKYIPVYIVQGRYDVVCPMTSAWDLHKALPEANLTVIQDAGHSIVESGIRSELIRITDNI